MTNKLLQFGEHMVTGSKFSEAKGFPDHEKEVTASSILESSNESDFLEAFGDKKGEVALKHLKSKKYRFGDFHVVNTRAWEDDEGKKVVSLLVQKGEGEPFDVLIEE